MKTHKMSLGAVLLATTALSAMATGQASAQDASVQPDPAPTEQPKEIIVRGKNVPKTMRRTAEVTSILTNEDLKRTGDDNAAAALTRVTGLSLVEGKFIYVRGLGERYSSALLNGAPLPSPEPMQRVVPLDLFPANLLNRVSVQKTYSVEYPGEFGGGVVDLQTTAIPTRPFFTFGLGTGFNSETTGKAAVTHYGSDSDFLGFDDGTRKLPLRLRNALAGGKLINSLNFPSTGVGATNTLQKVGQDFQNANVNLLQEGKPDPAFSFNTSAGRAFDVLGGKLGVVSVVDFSNNWSVKNGTRYEDTFQDTANNVSLNGLMGIGYTRGAHALKWTGLYIHKSTKRTATREGFDGTAVTDIRKDRTGWYERQLGLSQLVGDHQLMPKLALNWNATYAVTVRDTPYEKYIRYQRDTSAGPTNGLYFSDIRNSGNNETAFSNLKDIAKSFGATLSYDYSLGEGRDGKLVGGFSVLDNRRDYQRRAFEFKSSVDSLAKYERVDFLLSDFNIRPDLLQLSEIGSADAGQGYASGLFVRSYFVKTDVEVIPLVRVAAGVRFEQGKERNNVRYLYQTTQPIANGSTTIKEEYALPSGTVTWNFREDMQLRMGASKTIGRPQFRELAEPTFRDPETDRTFIGNPYLKDTELTNLDGRYEWYYGSGEYLTIGAFHKTLDNPVETIIGGQGAQTFVNAPKAKLYGTEIDYKGMFESPIKGAFFDSKSWLVQANYTYTKSELEVKAGDKIAFNLTTYVPIEASTYIKNGDRLQGQSDHLANLQFGWTDDQAESQASLLVTYVSERVSVRGLGISSDPNILQEPGTQLDFIYRKGFEVMDRKLNFSLEARNLLNTEYKEYQEGGASRVYVDRYKPGTSVSLSLSTSF